MSQSRPSEFVRRTVALPGTGAGTTATSQPAHNRARAGPQARGCGAKTPPPPNRERARVRGDAHAPARATSADWGPGSGPGPRATPQHLHSQRGRPGPRPPSHANPANRRGRIRMGGAGLQLPRLAFPPTGAASLAQGNRPAGYTRCHKEAPGFTPSALTRASRTPTLHTHHGAHA